MNPFEHLNMTKTEDFQNFSRLYPHSYNKHEVDPYTKCRIILMNGTEFEANWFSHQFERHTDDIDLRRAIAKTREIEKQQQLKISLLKPQDETILEHTIGYEQLAVDLTAALAKREPDCYVKNALDFALLEDFDHLYRYSDLLEMVEGTHAEKLVGKYTEIMPARPTIAHHRYPTDNVKRNINYKGADIRSMLSTMIITAAEQQTMNYYMNVSTFAPGDLARRLYMEIALVEEEHVTQYESLIDPNSTWLEMLLCHEYCECYLYWSAYMTETDNYIKSIWEENLAYELSHLDSAVKLLEKYEKKSPEQVIPKPTFPEPLKLESNIEYVRDVLGNTVQFTSDGEGYTKVEDLGRDSIFFKYQDIMNPDVRSTPSHAVIDAHIKCFGRDYRYEVAENPIRALRSRVQDNTSVGRVAGAAKSTSFKCN